MRDRLTYAVLILVFLVGLLAVLYPSLADYHNSKVQTQAIGNYESVLSNMSKEDYTALFEAADEYNRQLAKITQPFMNYKQVEGYNDILNVGGNGIIGYVSIDKISVEIPIYHGTSKAVLSVAAGHLEGSSLPVGGSTTHAAISAHRGLPSAKLFTNLDKVDIGDTFTITVLDRVLTYQVDSVLIVNPNEMDSLYVTQDEDHCTLITCTPYGINTHRLLVRGTRIETVKEKPPIFVKNEAFIIDPIIVTPIVAIPMLLMLLVFVLIRYRKKK